MFSYTALCRFSDLVYSLCIPVTYFIDLTCRKVLSMDEYASYFENIDPLSQYKMASNENITSKGSPPRYDVFSERVQAAFVVSDPVDWSRDIQVFTPIFTYGFFNILFTITASPLLFSLSFISCISPYPIDRRVSTI